MNADLFRRKLLNQELSLREYGERKVVLSSKPSQAIIELTQNCNFKCVMCPQAYEPKYKKYDKALNMDLALFDKVAEAVFPDAYQIDLRGFGETMILPYWPEILDRLENYPLINWNLVTNLSVPRDATWERMVKLGFSLGFSCDAAEKKTFEEIRVGSHFDQILHNLELVTSTIRTAGKGYIYLIVTIQKGNVQELPKIIELAHRYSVPEVQFKIVKGMLGRRNGEAYLLDKSDLQSLVPSLEQSLDRAIELGVRVTLNDGELVAGQDQVKLKTAAGVPVAPPRLNFPPRPDPAWDRIARQVTDTYRVSLNQRCFKGHHYTYINSDGKVGTCNHMMEPKIVEMGDLKTQSFEEIWNGDAYQFFRGTLLRGTPTDARCEWCFKHRVED